METRFPLADCLVIYPWETLFVLFEEGYAGVVYDNNHNANRSRLRSKPFSKERELVESLLVAYAILCVANRYSKNGLIDLYGHFIGVFWKPLMDKIKNFRKETFGKVDVPALCEKANVSTTIEKSIGEALNFFLSIPEPEEKDYSLQIEDAKKKTGGGNGPLSRTPRRLFNLRSRRLPQPSKPNKKKRLPAMPCQPDEIK